MGEKGNKRGENRLRVVPHFSAGIIQRAKRERALKSPHAACRLFSCRVILTRARVSLALLSVRKNWGLLVVQGENVNQPVISHHQTISPPRKRLAASQLATKQHFPVLKMLQTIVLGYELGNNPGLFLAYGKCDPLLTYFKLPCSAFPSLYVICFQLFWPH